MQPLRFNSLRKSLFATFLLSSFWLGSVFLLAGATLQAAEADRFGLSKLPASSERTLPPDADWLIDNSSFKAKVCRAKADNTITLENGLVRRTFQLGPNCATVGLDNLVSGQALLRAVRPEAMITLDGRRYEVGGLSGQLDLAYIRPEWLKFLHANPQALQFVGLEVSKPKSRLAWKRVRHHAPNVEWPPKGVHLRLDFEMPHVVSVNQVPAALPSATRRALLLEEDFMQTSDAWMLHVSSAHPRSSFENEGKFGEIYTPMRTAVFAERKLPEGTRLVEVTLDAGTDKSTTWGPGLALVFKDRVVKFTFRPGDTAGFAVPWFSQYDGGREHSKAGPRQGKLDRLKRLSMRLRIDKGAIFTEIQQGDQPWRVCRTIRMLEKLGPPLAVRVGKMDSQGGPTDAKSKQGDLVRMRIQHFAAYGALKPKQAEKNLAKAEQPRVSVHYELYDGIPAMSKWLTVENRSKKPLRVDRFTSETLALVEKVNWVSSTPEIPVPKSDCVHVETDFSFGGFTCANANRHVVHWRLDPKFGTQVNWAKKTPCLLEVSPTYGPAQVVQAGDTFLTFRTFVLSYDSEDRERRSLSHRKLYRTVAPWVTENPITMHMTNGRDMQAVRRAIDQCAEVGFETMILSFGSGFSIESKNPAYLAKWKEMTDYARSKGVDMGGYSLLSSRRVGDEHMIVSPKGQRPTHGKCPALTSEWGQAYFARLKSFFETTGFQLFEHDGSYPGDVDVTARPPLQTGIDDSRWAQWRVIAGFYSWCRSEGIYLNVPDFYFMNGGTKCGMGYREVNWSQPRAEQTLHTRQNIFDGTWEKTPSMGWMFIPLTNYHGGGTASTIEPLDQHLEHYRRMIDSNFGLGVQPFFRGPRLYDTDRTREMLKGRVAWYKKYREILESDLIHSRRADGRRLDWMLHVNPQLREKGMLVVYNPLRKKVSQTIRVNLYYTGLTDLATIRVNGGEPRVVKIDRQFNIDLSVEIDAQEMTWVVIE